MQSTSLQLSPIKDGRRVLGEKTANACLSPAPHRNAEPLVMGDSPIKRTLFEAPSPTKHIMSPSRAGQKRTIDQVEESEVNKPSSDGSPHLAQPRNEEPPQEDSSQSTVQNDSQQTQEPDAGESDVPDREPQQTPPQSDITTIEPVPSSPRHETKRARTVPEDPEARKSFIQEKATLLRSRIQSAMRHVRDNQFDRRLSALEAHSRKLPRLSFPVLATPSRDSLRRATTPPSEKTPTLQPAAELKPASPKPSDTPGLSSPPPSAGTVAQESLKTPPHRDQLGGSPMQLSSPPATVLRRGHDKGGVEEATTEGRLADENEKLVTPSQKGDAVDGLMKLMKTADRIPAPVGDMTSR